MTLKLTLRAQRLKRSPLIMITALLMAFSITSLSSGEVEARRHRLAKQLDRRLMGKNGIGLIGAKLNMHWAGFDAELDNQKDPLINDPSSMLAFGFGVTLDRSINHYVGFRAEALYQNKNFTHDSPPNYDLKGNAIAKVQSETYLDYIELPVGVLVRLMPGHIIQPYTSIGMYGAMIVNGSGKHEDFGTNENPIKPFSFFDYGWYLSAGSYFVLAEGAGFLGAELKYSRGLANMADTGTEVPGDASPLKSQVYTSGSFALSVSYYF